MKAFGYTRVSGKGQLGGDGPERQRLAIQAYADANGIEIVGWFEESICGAKSFEERPAWMRMISSLNGTRTIIIERLDRMARDLMVSEHIIADLRRRDVTLISTCEDDVDSENPTRVLVRQILSAIAGYDRSMTVLKLRGARERMRATGERCEGSKPFGSKPGEDSILEGIKDWDNAAMTCREIASRLNESKVPTRFGKSWHGNTVARILRRSNAS